MNKAITFGVVFLVSFLLLGSLVIAAKPDSEPDPLEALLQSILDTLTAMLTSVENIEAKNETIIVNVESSNNETCQWENLNQKQDIDLFGTNGGLGFAPFTETLHIPIDKSYEDVNVISGRVKVKCTGSSTRCRFLINGVSCGNVGTGGLTMLFEIPQNCIDATLAGNNNITLEVASGGVDGEILQTHLEMEVLPANC